MITVDTEEAHTTGEDLSDTYQSREEHRIPDLRLGEYSHEEILAAYHDVSQSWLGEQTDERWEQYLNLCENIWNYPEQYPEDAVDLFRIFTDSENPIDRLIAATALPKLLYKSPEAAFDLWTRLLDDEVGPVARMAHSAIERAREEGYVTKDMEWLFSGRSRIAVLSQYRGRDQTARPLGEPASVIPWPR